MKPISKDLRYRVINYLESKQSYSSAAKKFEISENSARRWYSRYKETGSLELRTRYGGRAKISDSYRNDKKLGRFITDGWTEYYCKPRGSIINNPRSAGRSFYE